MTDWFDWLVGADEADDLCRQTHLSRGVAEKLVRNGYRTMEQLRAVRRSDLRRIKGFGRITVGMIKEQASPEWQRNHSEMMAKVRAMLQGADD